MTIEVPRYQGDTPRRWAQLRAAAVRLSVVVPVVFILVPCLHMRNARGHKATSPMTACALSCTAPKGMSRLSATRTSAETTTRGKSFAQQPLGGRDGLGEPKDADREDQRAAQQDRHELELRGGRTGTWIRAWLSSVMLNEAGI